MHSTQLSKYMSTAGVQCILCESNHVEGGAFETHTNEAYREVRCHSCNIKWVDKYRLVSICEFGDEAPDKNVAAQLALLAEKDEYRAICLSTGYLSPCDMEKVDEVAGMTNNMVLKRDTGYFIKLYDVIELNGYGFSTRFMHLLDICLSAGFRLIEFDSDGPIVDGLEVPE